MHDLSALERALQHRTLWRILQRDKAYEVEKAAKSAKKQGSRRKSAVKLVKRILPSGDVIEVPDQTDRFFSDIEVEELRRHCARLGCEYPGEEPPVVTASSYGSEAAPSTLSQEQRDWIEARYEIETQKGERSETL